jgi:type VII secretion integral membrane protein EccD
MAITLDARSRVTVVGTRRRVDVAVPTAAPIGEYVADLVELCGQDRSHPLPASWSLAPAGAGPLPLEASLGSSGMVDGAVLYLRDVARDPGASPIVDDVEELVADRARSARDTSLPAGLVVVGFGLLWIAATAVLAIWPVRTLIGPAVALSAVGLALIAVAWSLHQRPATVPAGLRLTVALTAVPCLAAAGALLVVALAGSRYGWSGAIAGANLGGLLALAAIPEGVLVAVEVHLGAAALITPVLWAARATPAQAAAVVVLVGLALIGLSKVLAAAIAAWSAPSPKRPMDQVVTTLLVRSRRLLTAVLLGPTVALVVAFVVLAASGQVYAVALTAVASLALVVRARQRGFTTEVVLIGGAGVAGLFAVAVSVLDRMVGETVRISVFGSAGLGLVGLGVAVTLMRRADQPAQRALASPGDPASLIVGTASRPDRLRFIDVLGIMSQLACACLALGVFGVFGDLVLMGRSIVG